MNVKNKIIMASGKGVMDDHVAKFPEYDVVSKVDYKNELEEACRFFKPDILLIGESLGGSESLIAIMLRIKQKFPDIRIIYLPGFVDLRDDTRVNSLGMLVMSGIYDIIHEKTITLQQIRNLLGTPKTADAVAYLSRRLIERTTTKSSDSGLEFEVPDEKRDDEDDGNNIYTISSIKPGTGKSFLSTNIATAIAKFGVNNEKGERPKVAIIEADLQNLSIGTLLGVEDDKRNLKTVMEQIKKIVMSNGELANNVTPEHVENVNKFIHTCFKPYYGVKNLECLTGSQLTLKEVEEILPFYYIYLIEAIQDYYDVIIIDTNSSLHHTTTYPLLQMSKTCYYVMNLDFNNVRNNVRYREALKELDVAHKVKYILNEDIRSDGTTLGHGEEYEALEFSADHLAGSGFKTEAEIPLLPKTIFLNRLYQGIPIVLDENDYTLKARQEIFKVSNQIYPLQNMEEMTGTTKKLKVDKVDKTVKKKKRGFFRK